MKKKLLYTTYNGLILFLSPFVLLYYLLRLLFRKEYRGDFFERLGFVEIEGLERADSMPTIWLHAVSVGEVNAVIPLVKRIMDRDERVRVILSTITPTGRLCAKKHLPSLKIIYLPVDIPFVIRRVLRQIRPDVFAIVETEIWPNLLRILKEEGIPTILINGRLSRRSFKRYQMFGFFFSTVIREFDHLSMQTAEDADRIIALGAEKERVSVTGNMKYDQADLILSSTDIDKMKRGLGLDGDERVIVAGSTHPGEEETILRVFLRLKEDMDSIKLILAPRHPERFSEVESIVKDAGLEVAKRSCNGGFAEDTDVLLLDTIGELKGIYSISTLAFVGGSLVDGVGGQNMIEPAQYRKPVLFGPNVDNFLAVAENLINGGGGIMVREEEELYSELKRLLMDEDTVRKMGDDAYMTLERNRGTVDRTIEILERYW